MRGSDPDRLARAVASESSSWWATHRARRALARIGVLLREQPNRGGEALGRAIARAARNRGRAIAVAADHLETLAHPQAREGLFRVWAETRAEELSEFIERIGLRPPPDSEYAPLALLRFDGPVPPTQRDSTEAVLELRGDRDPQVANAALTALRTATSHAALITVGRRWVEDRDPLLAEMAVAGGAIPTQPNRVRVLVGLLVEPQSLTDAGLDLLPHLLEARADSEVGSAAHRVLRQLTDASVQEALAYQALEGDEDARALCVEAGYLPKEDHERALFLFLTEQWDRYHELDFDGRLLAAAYEAVPQAVQARIRSIAAASGRSNALRVVLGGDRATRIRQLTELEANFLVEQTAAVGDHEALWGLVFDLPMTWALPAVGRLAAADWQPERLSERKVFDQLRGAFEHGVHDQVRSITDAFPVAARRASVRFNGRINGLAFTPHSPRLLIGSNKRVVGVWDLQRAQMVGRYDGFRSSVAHVVALDADRYIVGTRTSGASTPCHVTLIDHPHRAQRPLTQHLGSVTGLVMAGDRAISSGRDHQIRSVDESGKVHVLSQLPDWPRALARMGNSSVIAVHSGLSRVDLDSGHTMNAHDVFRRKPTSVTVGPNSADVLAGFRSGEVAVVNFQSDSYRMQPSFHSSISGVSALASVPERGLAFVGQEAGYISAIQWPSRNEVGTFEAGGPISSLTVSPGEEFLAVGHPDDSATLWDLRVGEIPSLFTRPLIETSPSALAMLDAAAGDGLNETARLAVRTLQGMLRHRFRHDIEVEELIGIRAGRYDIAIDEETT